MLCRLFHTSQKVIKHGLSPTLVVVYVMEHNRNYLVVLRSFSCNPPKGIGWNKVTGLGLIRAYCRLMLLSSLFAADVDNASGTAGKSRDVSEGVCLVSHAGVWGQIP